MRREELTGYAVPGEVLELRSDALGPPAGFVAVTLPADYAERPTKRWPLLIALGGAGEMARPGRDNALAWMEYYDADEAFVALSRGRLERADFRGLVTDEHLARVNARLERRPWRGLILACPSLPRISADHPLDSARVNAYVMHEVLPALLATYRVRPGAIGIDGVSMGGARAMWLGLSNLETFASLGGLQGAYAREMPRFRELVTAHAETLRGRPIQLVTSDGDGLRPAVELMHRLLDGARIEHRFELLTGPHDYVFNRGPGVLTMLMFHEEALSEP